MWTSILAGLVMLGAQSAQTDTTFAVDARARLRMEGLNGDVVVRTWDRPEMRVKVTDAEGSRLRVSSGPSTVSLTLDPVSWGPGRSRGSGDLDITMPATMSASINGLDGDVSVEGSRGEVVVQTTQGDIRVTGGGGLVQLRTVHGDIDASGIRGRVDAHAVNGDIKLTDVVGDAVATTMSGDVHLVRVDAASVDASSVSGDIAYDGAIKDAGRYALKSHSGDVTVAMPASANAIISVSTFNGDFQADIPVQLTEQQKGTRFSFTLGSGSARVDLESFSGDIRLARPGFAATTH